MATKGSCGGDPSVIKDDCNKEILASHKLSTPVVRQGSVFITVFLFAVVMDVVCGDVMEGLLFAILYVVDLVLMLMADSMEELQLKW